MAAHMNKVAFYPGLVPSTSHFDDLQKNAYATFQKIQSEFITRLAKTTRPASYSVANFNVSIAANSGVDRNGLGVAWDSNLLFECANSTRGSYVGTTAPGTGLKRYIICAVRHALVSADPHVSPKDGLTYYYELNSTAQPFIFAASAPVATTNVWYSDTVLSSLYEQVIADDSVPLLICERYDGSTGFSSDQVHQIGSYIAENGALSEDVEGIHKILANALLGIALTTDGTVAGTPSAVYGTGGQLSVTGGEFVAISAPPLGPVAAPERHRRMKAHVVVVPPTILSFADTNDEYIVRAKLQTDGTLLVYKAKGSWLADAWPGAFATGTPEGTSQGFSRTAYDIPLFRVVTGSAGTLPVVTAIVNSVDAGVHDAVDVPVALRDLTDQLDAGMSVVGESYPFPTNLMSLLEEVVKYGLLNRANIHNELQIGNALLSAVGSANHERIKVRCSDVDDLTCILSASVTGSGLHVYFDASNNEFLIALNAFYYSTTPTTPWYKNNTSEASTLIAIGPTSVRISHHGASSAAWLTWDSTYGLDTQASAPAPSSYVKDMCYARAAFPVAYGIIRVESGSITLREGMNVNSVVMNGTSNGLVVEFVTAMATTNYMIVPGNQVDGFTRCDGLSESDFIIRKYIQNGATQAIEMVDLSAGNHDLSFIVYGALEA